LILLIIFIFSIFIYYCLRYAFIIDFVIVTYCHCFHYLHYYIDYIIYAISLSCQILPVIWYYAEYYEGRQLRFLLFTDATFRQISRQARNTPIFRADAKRLRYVIEATPLRTASPLAIRRRHKSYADDAAISRAWALSLLSPDDFSQALRHFEPPLSRWAAL